ncbi:SPW repeat protein [Rhizobium jaguaris]|uniref:SPW repeat protein n=1 Tax=Rhizobium jaguaris TaxID=1312183 RepID=UPI0039BF840B
MFAAQRGSKMKSRRWQDHIIFIIGLWLTVSPWIFGAYGSDSLPAGLPAWNFFFCGLIVAALGGAAYTSYDLWEDWIDILPGSWLMISPWVLQFTEHPLFTWNALASGLLLIVLAVWVLLRRQMPKRSDSN